MGYSNSKAMLETMNYQDNDVSFGIISTKPYTRSFSRTTAEFVEARQGVMLTVPSPLKVTQGN